MSAGVAPAFFFSSRRRHTRYWRDWSSDVCSSDLAPGQPVPIDLTARYLYGAPGADLSVTGEIAVTAASGSGIKGLEGYTVGLDDERSEERRVGKECRSRWSPYH